MSTLPGNPTALKTKVEGLITSANSIQSAIDDLNKFVTTSKSKAVAATQKEVQNAEKSLEAAHGRYKNTGLALREYQAVLADCHKRADAASAREESANRQRNDAQRTVTATKKRLQQLQSSHAPSVNVQNAQNAVQQAMSNERRAAKAATFNAAGVSFTSMVTATYAAKMNGFDTNPVNARARVENYHFSTDPLTNLQKYASLPEAYGKQIEVKASRDDWAHFNDINRGHGLDAMKRQYDAEHGHAYADRQKPSEKWDAPILLPEPERPPWVPVTVPTGI